MKLLLPLLLAAASTQACATTDDAFSGVLTYKCSAAEAPTTVAFGGCDREAGVACAPATKFRIGSMSKSFTAAAVLALAEDHKLTLDDPLATWLPEYPRANLTKDGVAVTLRTLLSHESGVPAWEGTEFFKSHLWVATVTLEELMASVSGLPLVAVPGTTYAYSNTGYNLLALVVERASGARFEDFLRARIFGAAGLADTGITLPGQAGLAKGYYKNPAGHWGSLYDHAEFIDRDMTAMQGSGSVYATAGDVLRWLDAFSTGKVVSPASVALALAPNLDGYGFGWTTSHLHATPLHWHNGALSPAGFAGEMGFNSERGFAYALLGNVDVDDVDDAARTALYREMIARCAL